MEKITLLIKSNNKETLWLSFTLLKERYPNVNNFDFVFYNRSRDNTILPAGINVNTTVLSVYNPSELKAILKDSIAISVTGLPQEDFALLSPVLIQLNRLSIFSLTKDSEGRSIMLNLVDEGSPLLQFRKKINNRVLILRCVFILIVCGFGINIVMPVLPHLEDPTIALYSNYLGLALSASGLIKTVIPKF